MFNLRGIENCTPDPFSACDTSFKNQTRDKVYKKRPKVPDYSQYKKKFGTLLEKWDRGLQMRGNENQGTMPPSSNQYRQEIPKILLQRTNTKPEKNNL